MKQYDPATLAQLGNRRASIRNALRLDLIEGTFGFWNGSGKTIHDSVEYAGAGKFLELRTLGGADDFSSSSIEVRLSSIPDSPLTPGVLATFNDYTWHQQPATLYDVYLHPDTRAEIKWERIARRKIDLITYRELRKDQAVLITKLASLNLDNPGRGYLRYNDVDQRLIDPNDAFFQFAATIGSQQINWGRPGGAGTATPTGIKVS